MKGLKLSLQEVLKLEDGCKVWVEISEEYKDYSSYIPRFDGILYKRGTYLSDSIRPSQMLKYKEIRECLSNGYIYEWIEESEIPYPNNMQQTIHNLATEILNLRSLDLTDENIEMIIKEFSWQIKWDEL